MNGFKVSLLAGAVALVAGSGVAQATIITTAKTYTNFAQQLTDFTNPETFALFDSNLGTLQKVILGADYSEKSQLTVTNTNQNSTASGSANTFSIFTAFSTNTAINSVLQNYIDSPNPPVSNGFGYYTITSVGNSQSFSLSGGGSVTVSSDSAAPTRTNPYNTTTGDVAITTTTDLAPFMTAGGGTANITASTKTGTTVNISGGNAQATQVTNGVGDFYIQYVYDDSTATPVTPVTSVPEPASLALLGAGLLGLGMIRRNRA